MKQVLQHARTGEIKVEEVPAPQLLPGCVLVRIAASVVSAGTERASAEFARKSLLQKAQSRPDLVREVISKVQRDGIFSAIQAVRSRLDQPQSPGLQQRRNCHRCGRRRRRSSARGPRRLCGRWICRSCRGRLCAAVAGGAHSCAPDHRAMKFLSTRRLSRRWVRLLFTAFGTRGQTRRRWSR